MKSFFLSFLFFLTYTSVKSQLIEPNITFNGIDSIQLGLPRFVFKEEYKKAFTGSNENFSIYYRVTLDSVTLIRLAGIGFKMQGLYFNQKDSTLSGIEFINLYGHKLALNKFVDIQSDVEKLKTFVAKQIGKKPKSKKLNSYKGSINERFIWKQR